MRTTSRRSATGWCGRRYGAGTRRQRCATASARTADKPPRLGYGMYHQISRNKRNSLIVIVGFLAVWLLAGFVIGGIAYADTSGAIVGAVVLGILGVLAALYAYYFGSGTVLSAMGAQEADPRQSPQLINIVQTLCIGSGLPMPKVSIIND